jgi:hypothetical protein
MRQGCHYRLYAAIGLSTSLLLLAGCAQDPVAMIPKGPRTVLEHEVQFAPGDHQPISVDQLLARARGDLSVGEAATGTEAVNAPATAGDPAMPANLGADTGLSGALDGAKPLAGEWRSAPSTRDTNPNMVTFKFADEASDPTRVDDGDRARLWAAIDRLPPSVKWRGHIDIGPTASGDSVVGLAYGERRARSLGRMLPARLQPAQVQYRPDLPPGTVTIVFLPQQDDG